MRFPNLALAFVLAAGTAPAIAQAPSSSAALSLAEAMRLAETTHPNVRAREAQLAAAEGIWREASALVFNNPELSTERARRRGDAPAGTSTDWGIGIAQPFETGGQQALRREASAAGLEALRSEIEEARRQAPFDAATRFLAVLAAQRKVQLEKRSVDLFDGSAQAVAKRRAAGEDTRLDANVAQVEAERARNAFALAGERLAEARSELATAVRLPPSALPEVTGEAGPLAGKALSYTLDQLLASAQAQPKQLARAFREAAARARLGVERASRYPDVTVGLHVGRESPGDARERLSDTVCQCLNLDRIEEFTEAVAGVGA